MASLFLAWNNRVDAATLAGGSWEFSLPLVNMQNRQVQKVARTTNDSTASTQFTVDLNSTSVGIGAIALVVHNMSSAALIRITGSLSSTFATTDYTSGWVNVWDSGAIPQELLEWENDNFWSGTMSEEARAGYNSAFIHVLPTSNVYRYWKIEIDDTANPDGYIQIGRLFMALGYSPSFDRTEGAEFGWQDPSLVETSLSGAEYFDTRTKYRTHKFELGCLTKTEAYSYLQDLQRVAGVTGEVLVVPDRSDASVLPFNAFLGRIVSLSPITQKLGGADGLFYINLEIKELV